MFLRLRSIALVGVTFFVLTSLLCAQTVISRTRVGNTTEGSTYVSTGPLAGSIAVVDGFDVFTFPANSPRASATHAFDLWELALADMPRGIAYMPKEKLFVFSQNTPPTRLFFSDHKGHARGTLDVQYLNGYVPNWIEGVTYIPPDANSLYPDHFVIAANNSNTGDRRLEVVSRKGASDLEIILTDTNTSPPAPTGNGLACAGIQYVAARDTILCGLTSDGNYLVEYTFGGTVVSYTDASNPIYGIGYLEGVTLLPNGNVVLAGVEIGKLTFLNPDFTRAPELDRAFLFSPGLIEAIGLAWNSDTNQYLIYMRFPPGSANLDPGVWRFDRSFAAYSNLIPIAPAEWNFYRQMVYLSDEHKLAILYRHRPTPERPTLHPDILLYDNSGNLLETLHLDNVFTYRSVGSMPSQLAYIPGATPGTGQFLLRQANFDGTATPYARLISRSGELAGTLDLTGTAMANGYNVVTYFDNHLLFQVGANQMVVTELDGAYVREFSSWSSLQVLTAPTAFVSSGTDASAFATYLGGDFVLWQVGGKHKKK